MRPYTFDIHIARDDRPLVSIAGFRVRQHHLTFLFGESGIGKSLCSRAIAGLLDPDELEVTVNGESYAEYRRSPQAVSFRRNGFFVFQEPSSHLNPLMRLDDQLAEGSLRGSVDRDAILKSLWSGSTTGELNSILRVFPKPHRPSGGEKQRILCAMAFAKMGVLPEREDGLFVFDEPTGSLDNRYRDIVLEMLIDRFRHKRCTVLFITHDYSMISVLMQNYRELRDALLFEELSAEGGITSLRPFQPDTYTSWLSRERSHRRHLAANQGPALLTVESGMEVVGRTLTVSRDPEGSKPCPLVIPRETITYLKAPSGTGKTTLVKTVMGLGKAEFFRATFLGSPLTEQTPREFWRERIWGKRMTMVFQHADEALNLRATVWEVFSGLPTATKLTHASLEEELRPFFGRDLGMGFLQRTVSTLSGGQKQKLNLLRGLLLDTDLLILDEPLNGLDFASLKRVLELLRTKVQHGRSMLVISHNEEIFDAWVPASNLYYLTAAPGGRRSVA
jgi:peptide/nickel transport system ATP-binding protein